MTGSPLDGAPWYYKMVVYAIYAPIYTADKVKEVAHKIFKPRKSRKIKERK